MLELHATPGQIVYDGSHNLYQVKDSCDKNNFIVLFDLKTGIEFKRNLNYFWRDFNAKGWALC